MVAMQKANRQIDVNENEVDLYLAQGFSQLDEDGKIIKAGEATDLADIKAENATLKIKLAEYKDSSEKLYQLEEIQKENDTFKQQLVELNNVKAENEALKTQVADLTTQLEAATKKK